ncbi:VWA domain-containing protein [Lichenibacterium dinghuense]|uniref:VWA domain-containing protein n=1 Tax=Lichenibacterium dinghuense TaxID=2895977 RepID=UPI0028153203|nr:VWA domain-containing protein [Lichenibacterium sp. 6Y81]
MATLRAAAPWQAMRGRASPAEPLRIRRDDFRVARRRDRQRTTTIFAVDASGSAAMGRLAEAKGAVELLLAECYVRRDDVALIGFRGRAAELLLPPTRSPARAKRELASLPGGGATPLAAGLAAAADLAAAAARDGRRAVVALLTDGRGNVARDGSADRARAADEAHAAARLLRAAGVACLVIDTSPRPGPAAARLAAEMGATYLPLPMADARGIARAVKSAAEPPRTP